MLARYHLTIHFWHPIGSRSRCYPVEAAFPVALATFGKYQLMEIFMYKYRIVYVFAFLLTLLSQAGNV